MRPGAVAPLLALVATTSTAAHAAPSYVLRFEGGAELDSNPTRRETLAGLTDQAPALPSAATRLTVAGDLDQRLGERAALSLGGSLGLRRLMRPEAEGEDLLVGDAHAQASLLLADPLVLAIAGSYYDVAQRADSFEDARDFRSLAPNARLALRLGQSRVVVGGGWRQFTYKPARELDFAGPTGAIGLRHTTLADPESGSEWDVGLGATIEDRRFPASACAAGTTCTGPRHDRFVTVDADVTRTGEQLVGAGCSLQINDSDRFGESLTRMLAHLRVVWLLPLELSIAARAELVVTRYADAVPIGHDAKTGAFVTIEDEGRSSLRFDLSRPIEGRLEAGLRYTYYTHTPGSGAVHFQRHIGLVYLALPLGR